MLVGILKLILAQPLIEVDGITYVLVNGLTTGLACASTVANIYLAKGSFDDFVVSSLDARKFVRYIDDGGGICKQDSFERILAKLNSWHPSIRVQRKDCVLGSSIHLLDLQLDINSFGVIQSETFRKKECIFDYPGPQTCHPQRIFPAIINTICHRLLISNSTAITYEKHLKFYMGKLLSRGFNEFAVRRTVDKFPHWRRTELLCRAQAKLAKSGTTSLVRTKHKVLPLILKYSRGIESLGLCGAVHRASAIASKETTSRVRIGYTVGKNLFRRLYQITWRHHVVGRD